MLRLQAGTATLLIGPRSSAGVHGNRCCLDSEADIRHRLMLAVQDQASRDALRRFWAHWQGDARVSGIKDHSIIERIARLGVRGPLIVLLVTDTSLHRRDTAAARKRQVAEALENQSRARRSNSPVQPAGPVGVSRITPTSVSAPAPVDSSVIGPPVKAIGDWTIAEKLTAILPRTADSRKLSLDAQQQLKGMLSDPKFLAWVVGSLLVWFVSQFFVVGEILDMLLAGAALVLSGAGIFFALQSLVGAAHLIGRFVEVTRNAKTEKDLDAAADILAEIIVMIGITVLIAALTHATSRATSEGLQAKGSTIRRGPAEAAKPVERLPARSNLRPNAESAPDRTTEAPKADVVTRRAYLNEKFGRTGNLNQDINIRGNREIASGFFRSQGIPEEKIPGYLQGIDLSQPVTVETIGSGRSLYQYQPPGAPQGNWYSQKPNVSPDELGISPVGENRSAGTIEPKQLNAYQTSEPILVLRSTAAPVNDTWSVRGQSYPAAGGGTQLFSVQSPSIRPR